MNELNVKGVSIALIDDTTIVWQQGFGFTDSSKTQSVDERTLFSVQSVSKIVTATAFMMETENKTIDLDDKLRKYLPGFTIKSRFEADEVDMITFRKLLSHRAGLGHEAPKGNNFSPKAYSLEEHINSISDSWLKLPVGKFYCYSNIGIDLVGYTLAKNAGKSFESYMKDQILSPLQMKNSTFSQSEAYAFKNMARGFYGDSELLVRMIPMLPSAGLYSNAADLSRLVIFHLNGCQVGNKKRISTDLQNEMYTIQYPVSGQQAGYGLGIRSRPFHGGRLIHHRGGGYGYSTIVGWIPEYRIGLVILTNDGNGSSFINDILEQSMTGMIRAKPGTIPEGKIMVTDKSADTTSSDYLKSLQGTYKSARGILELVEDKGVLYINGEERIPLTPRSLTEFASLAGDVFIVHYDEGRSSRLLVNPPEADNNGVNQDLVGVDYILNVNDSNADFFLPNDAPGEPAGPAKPEWKKYIGVYAGANNDAPVVTSIILKNGYLYTTTEGDFSFTEGAARLTEFKPGLFFSSDGESMEFAGDSLFVGNRPFKRK